MPGRTGRTHLGGDLPALCFHGFASFAAVRKKTSQDYDKMMFSQLHTALRNISESMLDVDPEERLK